MGTNSSLEDLKKYIRKDVFAAKKWEFLNATSLGRRLKVKQLDALSLLFDAYEIPAGTTIFNEGDQATFMCLLAMGTVEIRKENRLIATVSETATFGELGIIDVGPRSASAIAKVESLLLVVPRARLQEMLEGDPPLGKEVLLYVAELMAQRLRKTTDYLLEYLEALPES